MNRSLFFNWFAVLVLGCGASTEGGPTGGKTNWLSPCDEDLDCATLPDSICFRNRCTKACERDAECADIGAGIECTMTAPPENQVCLPRPDTEPDSGTEPEPDAGPNPTPETPPAICDGSDEIRFFSTSGGGFVDEYYSFYGAYGHSFLAIDGHCNYWVSGDIPGLVRTGVLSAEQAEQVAPGLHFGSLAAFEEYSPLGCEDGGALVIRDPSGEAVCSCDCSPADAPPGYAEAFATTAALGTDLRAQGTEATGSIQLLIVDDESLAPLGPGVPWVIEFDPLANLFEYDPNQGSEQLRADSGLAVTDPMLVEQLRAARLDWLNTNEYRIYQSSYLHMATMGSDAGAPHHLRVYLRDHVPQAVLAEFGLP